MQKLVRVTHATKAFGLDPNRVLAVDDVTFSFGPGEVVCLQGASGSGKSTLLNLVTGLDLPDTGAIEVGDEVMSGISEDRRADLRLRRIGVVFQDNNLIDELTALENVALPLLALGTPPTDARELAQLAMRKVEVGLLADRRPAQMSGGQRQRVGIARGLVGDRDILVADEPTGALDSTNSEQLFKLVRQLADDVGAAVLIATHDPLAFGYATRMMTVRDGQVSEA